MEKQVITNFIQNLRSDSKPFIDKDVPTLVKFPGFEFSSQNSWNNKIISFSNFPQMVMIDSNRTVDLTPSKI